MRASRTSIILEADTVYNVEGNNVVDVMASQRQSSGVCDAGMYEMAQSSNLGGPVHASLRSKDKRTKIAYSYLFSCI